MSREAKFSFAYCARPTITAKNVFFFCRRRCSPLVVFLTVSFSPALSGDNLWLRSFPLLCAALEVSSSNRVCKAVFVVVIVFRIHFLSLLIDFLDPRCSLLC